MFECERCGSRYSSARIVGVEHCPRCLLRDETMAPLSLKVFQLPGSASAAIDAAPESADGGGVSGEEHLQAHGGAVGT
jgi:hypothetical protein